MREQTIADEAQLGLTAIHAHERGHHGVRARPANLAHRVTSISSCPIGRCSMLALWPRAGLVIARAEREVIVRPRLHRGPVSRRG